MRFDPEEHNKIFKKINEVDFITSTWIKHHKTKIPDNQVNVILMVQTGQATTAIMMKTEDINNLIELLELTLDNIKAGELELLALQTKAAALCM